MVREVISAQKRTKRVCEMAESLLKNKEVIHKLCMKCLKINMEACIKMTYGEKSVLVRFSGRASDINVLFLTFSTFPAVRNVEK